MNRSALWSLLAISLCGLSVAEDIEFLQPDGEPAKHVSIYRTLDEAPNPGGGGMMMGMGGGGMDDMSDMEDMMGGMDMGMGGGMGMGMGMEMPGVRNGPRARIDLLHDKPLDGAQSAGTQDGKLAKYSTYKAGDSIRHSTAFLATHRTGYCFIPPHSRVRSKVTIREPGYVRVEAPEGIVPTRYRVLACWQNGFAWPSTNQEMSEQGLDAKPCLDDGDWRFTPRFRVFNVGKFGEEMRVPPGEIRVAIVPHTIRGKSLEMVDSGDLLFDHLIHRGPSKIVVVTGREKETVVVEMPESVTATFTIPKPPEGSLPDWEDAPETQYFLIPENQQLPARWKKTIATDDPFGGDELGMAEMGDPFDEPGETGLQSIRRWSTVLNEMRSQRSSVMQIREASSISETTVRFDLIPPGNYRFIRVEEDALVTHYQQVAKPSDGTRFEMIPDPAATIGALFPIHTPNDPSLGLRGPAVATTLGSPNNIARGAENVRGAQNQLPPQGAGETGIANFAGGNANSAANLSSSPNRPGNASPLAQLDGLPGPASASVSPAKQLATIRKMRTEVEAVIEKMNKHRQRLLELESRLGGE